MALPLLSSSRFVCDPLPQVGRFSEHCYPRPARIPTPSSTIQCTSLLFRRQVSGKVSIWSLKFNCKDACYWIFPTAEFCNREKRDRRFWSILAGCTSFTIQFFLLHISSDLIVKISMSCPSALRQGRGQKDVPALGLQWGARWMWEMVYACKNLQKPSQACDKQSTVWEGSQRSVLTTNLCILEVTAPLICRSFLLLYVLDTLSLVFALGSGCSQFLKCFGEFLT
jgi:hypothetical protein